MFLSLFMTAAMAQAAPEDLALEAMRNYGRCVLEMQPAGVNRVLAMDFRTDEYRKQLRRLTTGHDRCVTPGDELRGGGLLFAGSLAEALMEKRYGAGLSAALVRPVGASPLPARSEIETTALCLALRAPRETAALLATVPASAEEKTAAQPLIAGLSPCLAAGQKMTLNKPALRAVLALAAYRIAADQGASGAKRN